MQQYTDTPFSNFDTSGIDATLQEYLVSLDHFTQPSFYLTDIYY